MDYGVGPLYVYLAFLFFAIVIPVLLDKESWEFPPYEFPVKDRVSHDQSIIWMNQGNEE